VALGKKDGAVWGGKLSREKQVEIARAAVKKPGGTNEISLLLPVSCRQDEVF
jgi:hypothetical protein